MEEQRQWLIIELLIWSIVLFLTIRNQWNRKLPSVGLPLIYLFSLSVNHWFGALVYALPWYQPQHGYLLSIHSTLANTLAGFEQGVYGVIAFGVGSIVLAPWGLKKPNPRWWRKLTRRPRLRAFKPYIHLGICSTLLFPLLSKIPSVGALIYSGISLFVAGLCLACWKSWRLRNRRALLFWLMISCGLPLFTLVTMGFMSFGTAAALAVLIFVYSFYRPRWKSTIIALLGIYLGLSIFSNYLSNRDLIRGTETASLSRIEQIGQTISKFELFNPFKQEHLESIDIRLNQNTFVGLAIERLTEGDIDYAHGETIEQAAASVIPRILWPNKPTVSGSSDLVSQYTGLIVANGTSFGVGQVLEFYLNFGSWGVFLGFLILGIIIRIIDIKAGYKLIYGDWIGFISWFLPGLSFIQPLGSLVDIVQLTAASIVFVYLLNQFYHPRSGKKRAVSASQIPSISSYRR